MGALAKTSAVGDTVVTRLDEATLRAIVEKGGGELFAVGSPDRGPVTPPRPSERVRLRD